MDKGYFTDYSHQPTQEKVRLALGSIYPLWERLNPFHRHQISDRRKVEFLGPAKSGWGFRYRRKVKALVALYPQKERIMAQVVLGKAQAERALNLKLGEKTIKILKESPQLRDGRWLSIPVLNETDAEDGEQLLMVKMRPIRRTE